MGHREVNLLLRINALVNLVAITGFAKLCTSEDSGEVEGDPRGGDIPDGKLKQPEDEAAGSLGGITVELTYFLLPAQRFVDVSDVVSD